MCVYFFQAELFQSFQYFFGVLSNLYVIYELDYCQMEEERCFEYENQEESELGF